MLNGLLKDPLLMAKLAHLQILAQQLTNCTATINDVSGSISNFTYTPVVMVDGEDNDIVSITPIRDDGASFQVTYIKPTDKKPVTTQTTLNIKLSPQKLLFLTLRIFFKTAA